MQDKPIFHVAAPSGWVNDPNGPLLYRGRFHLFYQHVEKSVRWGWGLCWGHVSSSDLVHWCHHPAALCPTPGGPDADGCFSGCAVVVPAAEAHSTTSLARHAHESNTVQQQGVQPSAATTQHQQQQQHCLQEQQCVSSAAGGVPSPPSSVAAGAGGVPVLLYTGVVRRPDAPAGLTPSSLSVSELCYEQQLAAVAADPDDPYLIKWVKCDTPVLRDPPHSLCLNCFRDPFVLERPSAHNGQQWRVMLGAGIRDPDTGLTCAGPPPPHAGQQLGSLSSKASVGAAAATLSTSGSHDHARLAARGAALVYRSSNLLALGWEFERLLCAAGDRQVEGPVWECPILTQVPVSTACDTRSNTPAPAPAPAPAFNKNHPPAVSTSIPTGSVCDNSTRSNNSSSQHSHLFCVSTGKSPSIYWLGRYADGSFDLDTADGPHVLDLGDLLYAPNLLQDTQGRIILWAWLSELPHPLHSLQDYAGCISLPRLLSLGAGGCLLQQPLPELQQLATGPSWQQQEALVLQAGSVRHVAPDVPSTYFSLKFTLMPAADRPAVGGFMLPAYHLTTGTVAAGGAAAAIGSEITTNPASKPTSSAGQGLLVLYGFNTCTLSVTVGPGVGLDLLQAANAAKAEAESAQAKELHGAEVSSLLAQCVAGDSSDSSSITGSDGMAAAAGGRRLGGRLRLAPGAALELQVFMDYSVLEVFTGDGQVLSTRLYRDVATGDVDRAPTAEQETPAAAAAVDDGVGQVLTDSCVESPTESCEPVPGGVWLLSGVGAVEVTGLHMSAMQSMWRDL